MIIKIVDISLDKVFKKYSAEFGIYRDLFAIDSFALEIRECKKETAENLHKIFLESGELSYIKSISEGKYDLFTMGQISTYKDISKIIKSNINEEIGHKISSLIKNFIEYDKLKINIGGKIFRMSEAHVIGILNITPDSFFDGGNYFTKEKATAHAYKMLEEGADIIDIGGESTRPGSDPVQAEEELRRVMPVIEEIKKNFPDTVISVDTYKSDVARLAIDAGCSMVNDISGFTFDSEMKNIIRQKSSTAVLMHIKGKPKTMQDLPEYENTVSEVYSFLNNKVHSAQKENIKNIIIDPGIGFGKRLSDNFELLSRLKEFKGIGCPIMIGVSNKSLIGNSLGLPADSRINATAVLEAYSIMNGARFIRTHNVKNAVEAKKLYNFIQHTEVTADVRTI